MTDRFDKMASQAEAQVVVTRELGGERKLVDVCVDVVLTIGSDSFSGYIVSEEEHHNLVELERAARADLADKLRRTFEKLSEDT